MTNRLARESSPYLLQHKDNPVDWRPWGDEAFAEALAEDKPLLVSVGYSACHWCHVMAHESFENEATAALMNDRFINVKVDREERPDVDSILMTAVQAMSGQGGWPLNAFLTPEGVPFYGGTYWPPEERHGMPRFANVLLAVSDAYRDKREEVRENAEQIRAFLHQSTSSISKGTPISVETLNAAATALAGHFDAANGGFGGAPKFPQPSVLDFLLRQARLNGDDRAGQMALLTLDKMSRGGIYDQIGGGFHRYSVDPVWLTPHFEKMLYDNAQLASTYLDAFRSFGDDALKRVVEETLDYLIREMRSEDGGFFSTQDADSEGEEGLFYVWTPEEIDQVVGGEDGPIARAFWAVTERGNFEHANILSVPRSADSVAGSLGITERAVLGAIARAKPKLYAARSQRVWPGRDEKIITSWNGMALRALAEASRALLRSDYLAAAKASAAFILRKLTRDGALLHVYTHGDAKIGGFLDDYALVVEGLTSLYEATFERRWFDEASRLATEMIDRFADSDGAGFFDAAEAPDHLIARPRDLHDGATPSGNAVAARALLRLHRFTGNAEHRRIGIATLEMMTEPMVRQPTGFGCYLNAASVELATPREVAIAGSSGDPAVGSLANAVFARFEPATIIGLADPADPEASSRMPFLKDRPMQNHAATAYLCERFACLPPVTDPADLAIQLEQGSTIEWREY